MHAWRIEAGLTLHVQHENTSRTTSPLPSWGATDGTGRLQFFCFNEGVGRGRRVQTSTRGVAASSVNVST